MLFPILSFCLLTAIFGVPLLLLYMCLDMVKGSLWICPALLVAPLLYTVCFVLTAGVLSLPFRSGIIVGKFPRDLRHRVYRKRRLYGLCWTSVYYFKPLYYLCLSIPCLKWLLFRLFGYKGSMNFTIYPDTWIRDLPLLSFGEGTYVSNRVTLGTNLALSNGQILVDKITCRRKSLVGHLALVGLGTEIGEGAEIGMRCEIGIRCSIGRGALVQPTSGLNHHCTIGENAVIGSRSHLELAAQVGPGIKIPPGSFVPGRSKILTQSDANALAPAGTAVRATQYPATATGGTKVEITA
jgi:carbonic anhydrase/acetyltransferase-like protein (isoleucine patch superfamily)